MRCYSVGARSACGRIVFDCRTMDDPAIMSSTDSRGSMNSTTSKIFTIIVRNCDSPSHARKIAELLRASFPHRSEHITSDEVINLIITVKADSLDSIRNVISPVVGKAEARFGSDWVWLENGKTSSEPPHYFRFEPPSRLRSTTAQN
jgi:hypothetical protein